MKTKHVWIPIAALIITSCGREFSAPPPMPQIESINPEKGFMDAPVEVLGINFATEAEDNLVFFGTENAHVLTASETSLTVEVPELTPGEEVYIMVSTTFGQATSPNPFTYQGPGHPIEEKLDHVIRVEWAPLAVTSVLSQDELDSDPHVVVASYTGRTASLVATKSGWHCDFGIQSTPISVALIHQDGVPIAYLTTVEVTPGEDNLVETRLEVITINDAADYSFPVFSPNRFDALPSIDNDRFQPFRLWPYCKQMDNEGRCGESGIVASDMFHPALLFLEIGHDQPAGMQELGRSGCPALRNSTHIADIVYDRPNDRFLAIMEKGPEIWSVPASGTDCPQRLWPKDDPGSDPAEWSRRFAAFTLNRSKQPDQTFRTFLYAADAETDTLIELEFADESGLPSDTTLTMGRNAPLWSAPYAMAIARINADYGRLYIACEEGIIAFDPDLDQTFDMSKPLPVSVTIPLPSCRGNTQSIGLIRYVQAAAGTFGPDEIVFADTVRDVVRIFPAGAEWTESWEIPLGVTAPQVATSRFSDTLYLADPVANAVRLIDRNSGIQTNQFPIFDEQAFGAVDIACLDAGKADILLVPLPVNQIDAGQSRTPLDRIVVRRAGKADDIKRWLDDGYQIGGNKGVHTETLLQGAVFHEMLPAPNTQALYLVRYGSDGNPGLLWSFEFDADSPFADGVIRGKDDRGNGPEYGFIDINLDPSVKLVRLNPAEDVIAVLDRPKDQPSQIITIPLADPDSASSTPINDQLSNIISDMVLRTNAADATFYLALPPLGQVAVAKPDGQIHFVETTGVPTRLYLSPDERRLYVAHNGEGKLSVLDIDCGGTPGCERVLTNIAVGAYPSEVLFHPSGKSAFLTHYMNNIISVIE